MYQEQGEEDQRARHHRPNAILEEGRRQVMAAVTEMVVEMVEMVEMVGLQQRKEDQRDQQGLDKAAMNIRQRRTRGKQGGLRQ